jgi:proteasome lid subunit RPN8/RPN11
MNTQQSYKKSNLSEISSKHKISLNIPDDALNKIKYLCNKIADVEWSGVLFYTIEGSIKEPASMKVEIKDILPMDKGTSTFTEYNLDNRFVDYMMDNPEAMMWKVGHIHSHNTMAVFFSNTDMEELHDNSPNYDFYLSLIVNNFMDFKAKIATVGHANIPKIAAVYYANDENGEQYEIDKGDFFVDKKQLYIYDCDITSNVEQIEVDEIFSKKVAHIMKPKPVSKPVVKRYSKPKTNKKKSDIKPVETVEDLEVPGDFKGTALEWTAMKLIDVYDVSETVVDLEGLMLDFLKLEKDMPRILNRVSEKVVYFTNVILNIQTLEEFDMAIDGIIDLYNDVILTNEGLELFTQVIELLENISQQILLKND